MSIINDTTRNAITTRKPVYTPKGRADGRVDLTKPGQCIQTQFDTKHADAPVVEVVKTGFEQAAYL